LEYTVKLEEYVDRLIQIVRDFLDISKIQTGRMEYRMEKIDFDALIEETVKDIRTTTLSHRILKKGKCGLLVYGDKNRLGQVIINLVNNAVKYSPKADKVVVSCQAENDLAVVKVTDYGIGIEKTQTEKIFEKYYRVNMSKRRIEGFGLGLYISAEIIRRHRGEIGVNSIPGKGSTFFFRIPGTNNKLVRLINDGRKTDNGSG